MPRNIGNKSVNAVLSTRNLSQAMSLECVGFLIVIMFTYLLLAISFVALVFRKLDIAGHLGRRITKVKLKRKRCKS